MVTVKAAVELLRSMLAREETVGFTRWHLGFLLGKALEKSDDVLHATRMVAPGTTEALRFVAPTEKGK